MGRLIYSSLVHVRITNKPIHRPPLSSYRVFHQRLFIVEQPAQLVTRQKNFIQNLDSQKSSIQS